jgi:parallel beta-helix repeat protein
MKKKVTISLVLILGSFLVTSNLYSQVDAKIEPNETNLNYIISAPIFIEKNEDLGAFPGDGSVATPYLIQNLNITNSGGGYGISITNVDVYFEIKDCYILADFPIILNTISSSNVKVVNNTIDAGHSGEGLFINSTNNVVIQDNYITRSTFGIYIENGGNLEIKDNYLYDNSWSVNAYHFTSSYIENNIFEENGKFEVTNSGGLDFINNTFKSNTGRLELDDVNPILITNNVFLDTRDYAIYLTGGSSGDIYGNYFVRNVAPYSSQAYDNTFLGIDWYFGTIGNFWSNLEDRVAYPIDESHNFDLYPFYNSDDDSLNDYEEDRIYFTDRFDEDTDDDKMPDDYEVENLLNPLIDDSFDDPDTDLLTNLLEYYEKTDPHSSDSDSDLLPDGYETFNGLNPLIPDSGKDFDGDGLTNWEEYMLGTMPNKVDSDSDGMEDKWENDNGLNPLLNDAYADPDKDYLSNYLEFIYDCDPFLNDTDGDSHIDSWEIAHGTDPNNPLDFPDEAMTTPTEESPTSFVYVLLTLIALSGIIISKRKR